MRQILASISVASYLPLIAALCPIHGPTFPYPTNLANSTIVKTALRNLTDAIDAGFTTGNSSYGPVDPDGATAIQIFSLEDKDAALYEYYHDGTTLSNTTGVQKVNGSSIFRIGSVSKLHTVYLVLAELGESVWNTPITDALPELRNRTKWKENPIAYVKWDEITLGSLAAQLSGVPRDFVSFEDLDINPEDYGLPPLTASERAKCTYASLCNRKAFFNVLDYGRPVYRPNTTPVYSNTGFMLLAYALESLSGKPYREIFKSMLLDPLDLSNTSYDPPDISQAAVPVDIKTSNWDLDLGDGTPMGGIYSSVNDLSKLGRSILNSTILDSNTTRSWLKPTTFTSDLLGAVGRPWEIYRVADLFPGRVIDIYTKAGDIGLYHTFFAVVPDYRIGIAVALAGGREHTWIDGLIVDTVIPALEAAAREQTHAAYAGIYEATDGLNSSLTLTTQVGKPGLGIQSWISNGTDIVGLFQSMVRSSRDVRVLPTTLERTGNVTEVAWRAVPDLSGYTAPGPFSACVSWLAVDILVHGNYPMDELVFQLDRHGDAVSVNPIAFKIELERQRKG